MSSWFFHSKRVPPIKVQPSQRSPAQSLLHYETGSPPPSARVDPKLKLQPRRPLRLWDYWKFGLIVASKGRVQQLRISIYNSSPKSTQRLKSLPMSSRIIFGDLGESLGVLR